MSAEEKKFSLYSIVLRFLTFKITANLKRIYLDVEMDSHKMILTAFYENSPTELELELLDDIETNSNAHIPDYFIESQVKLTKDYDKNEKHDFIIFAVYEEI